jgi:protocatechuate 3,4-dioxygenase beta subunit
VVTPENAALELLSAAGNVHLAPSSEIELARAGDGAADTGESIVTLRHGSAWFTSAGERRALALDVPTPLFAAPPAAPPRAESTSVAVREAPASPPLAPPATAPAPRVFAGHVAGPDGAKIPAFTVALLHERVAHQTFPPTRREFTDGDGFFTWPDPPSGKQRVFVYAPGFALRALGEFDFSAAPPELMLELEPGVTVRGSVLDPAGNPVPDALVFSESEAPTDGLFFALNENAFWLPVQARTGADGRFALEHVTPGVQTLRVDAAGFAPAWADGVSAPAAPEAELTFTLARGGAIEGQVAREDGGPEVGAELVAVAMDQVQRSRQSFALTRTDDAGHYRIEHLPTTTILVVRLRGNEPPDARPVLVVEGTTLRADFIPPRRGIHLHGRLVDAARQPLPFRNLGLFDAETASWSEDWVASSSTADGSYVFDGVQPGRYALYLVDDYGRGLRCVDELVLAPDALDVEHDVATPSGRFDVRVRAAEGGEALDKTMLIVTRLERDGRASFAGYGSTDADGRYAFVEQRPGRYVVTAYPSRPGLGFAHSEVVELGDGPGPSLELLLEPGGAVDVLVRAADGRALEGATVLFHDQEGAEHNFSRVPRSDSAGRYHAEGLRPGRYRVEAELAGYQSATTTFELRLGSKPDVTILLAPLPPR